MFTLGDLAVDALAVHRLTRLATRDEITEPIRETLAKEIEVSRRARIITDGTAEKLNYVLRCDWCMSIWAATFAMTLKYYLPEVWGKLRFVLAASTITGMIASYE
jgi:hypothetical protein